ncbi:MAG: hypothetical protein HKN12_01610, partial [Gemmatimonadetes bacterium]|nr:hypothetical protein [Gemmatimonadota bacterium]
PAVQAVLRAILLPEAATEAREAGVPEEEIRTVLADARKDGVPAERTEAVMREGTRRVRDGEPPKNFGQTVKAMIRDGHRGRALADAIHEHKAAMKAAKDQAKGKARKAAGDHDHSHGDGHHHDHDHDHDAKTARDKAADKGGKAADRAADKAKDGTSKKTKAGGGK